MLVAVSLKAYLGVAETLNWCRGLRDVVGNRRSVELVVFPPMTALSAVADVLRGSGIHWGSQDIAADSHGAQTGETPASVLVELGCRYAEIGHAERRERGESDDIVRRKVERAVEAGVTPFVCIGEPTQTTIPDAVEFCRRQLATVMSAAAHSPLVVAYEPVWAIGASRAAPAARVGDVARGIRGALAERPATRLVYGGAAGLGTITDLHPDVDGVFLGRFAHDLTMASAILAEAEKITQNYERTS